METDRSTGMPSNELKSRILTAVREQPAPTRKRVALESALFLVPAALAPIIELVAFGGARPGPRPLPLVMATAGGGLLLALGAMWIALGRGGQILGRARVWLLAAAALGPPIWVVWKAIWSTQYEGMAVPWSTRPGARCFGLTLAFALLPLVALAIVRRRSDPTHPRSLGAALGVAAGMYAAVMVDLWCPVGDLRHVVLGHALPIVILGIVGIWLGHRVLAVRSAISTGTRDTKSALRR
jgi:hypothetical protein